MSKPAIDPARPTAAGSPDRSVRRPSPPVLIGSVLAALIGGYVGLGLSLPSVAAVDVCTRCGVVRLSGVYTLPWTHLVLRRSASVVPSAVSVVLARHGIGQGHPHAFEPTQPIDGHAATGSNIFHAARSPEVAAFLDAVLTWADRPTADRWVDRTLSDATATRVRFAVMMAPPPPAGFADRSAFDAWWRSAEPRLEDAMAVP